MTTSTANINTGNTGVNEMYVTKRNGQKEFVSFDKILNRIKKVGEEVGIKINYTSLVIKVIDQLYDGISSTKIDELLGEQCASMSSIHPDYNILAGRITISNHHKNTSPSFSDVVEKLYTYIDKHGKHSPLVSTNLHDIVSADPEKYNALCDYNRDYLIDYFGFKTLERSYLMSVDKVVVERPQHMWLRVSIGIHSDNFKKVCETYGYMSQKYFTHATPTLFNAGTPHPQLSSCYLLAMEEDSIDGIFNTLKDCAKISKWAGGIGLHIHNVRASGSHINGTNGNSNGIVPMLRVFNNTAKYVDQCLHPSTVIYTTHGPIPIAECVPGMTAIFNRTGSPEIIEKVLEHSYYGNILSITLNEMSSKTLVITPEHPIYVASALSDDTTLDILVKDLDAGLVKMQWVEAKDLNKTRDYFVYPIPNYTVDNPALTEDICYIYGIILAGMKNYYSSTLSTEYKKFVHIYQSEEKIKLLSMFLDKHLINFRVEPVDDKFMLCFKPTTKLPFCMSDFYNKTYIHQLGIGKRWYFLPINKIKRIIDGIGSDYMDSDLQFLKLLAGDIENTYHCIRYKNNMLVSIKHIKETIYDGILYDLQMTNEHNYLVEGGLVHNGGGKRNGSFAIYLEPWHADVEMFLQMRKNHGDEELKARDLFYALWIPDLFMERVKTDGEWCLMCPDECPGLSDVWGAKFVELYEAYEKTGKVRKRMKARDLWFQMMDAQMETGTPYLLYKDACNKKSNQQNIGTIKSSNLCVAPETKILTDNGHIEIQTLEGQDVNVWNGKEYSQVKVFKTGKDQELIDVYTSDGCKLSCTKYHKFFIDDRIVEAKDLTVGDRLTLCDYPVIDGDVKTDVEFTDIVPSNHSITYKMDWFSLYTDKKGTLLNDKSLAFSTNSRKNKQLIDIKMMLQTCGINPHVKNVDIGHTNDNDIILTELIILPFELQKLFSLGFSTKLLNNSKLSTEVNSIPQYITIAKIVDEGRRDDTFCFTEPKRNAGIFNGIITSQCTEVVQYSDSNETAVCNLASIALPSFVDCTPDGTTFIDYKKLHEVTKVVTYNLNRIIDINFYPTDKTRVSNLRHRPIGIGVQGLADMFMMMNIAFKSDDAKDINKKVFETIYHAALEQSYELAIKEGKYETFDGSPASNGVLQFDLWGTEPTSGMYDWTQMKQNVVTHGLRNSLLLAPMPTASTSQILGFNECIEPITSNIYNRRTLAGEFILANKYLMNDLIRHGLWNEKVKNSIIANNGSIQHIDIIPEDIREKYRTVWEIPMKHLIDMAADRGVYICQSQSLNLWIEDPNYSTLTSMHFYSWSKGLKTGIYYLRRRGKHQAQKFTIEPEKQNNAEGQLYEETEDEICEMCSA